MSDKRVISTLRYWTYPEWTERVDIIDRAERLSGDRRDALAGRRARPGRRVRPGFIGKLVAEARRYPTVVLTGAWRDDQYAAMVLARLRRPPHVIMTEAVWQRGTSALDRAANAIGMRAMRGPHMTFCVLSSHELETFPRTWGVAPEQVRFTPFCYTLAEEELERPTEDGGGVFAGGDPLRDYGPLLEAATGLDVPIRIASRWLRPAQLPGNVRAGAVSPEEFNGLLRRASVVVVPLRGSTDRSAGQQGYLHAMALGKPVVATDAPGVRDYITDGDTGLIVPPGDAEALRSAIAWVLDPRNRDRVDRMRTRARAEVRERFTRRHYIAAIFGVVAEGPATQAAGGAAIER